jgi:fructoselysine transporter
LLFSLLFNLTDVIKGILAMRIVIQFMGQAAGVILLRRRWPPAKLPFKMWLYPLPAILAFFAWGAIFVSTGTAFMLAGIGVAVVGIVVFAVRARYLNEWPFETV